MRGFIFDVDTGRLSEVRILEYELAAPLNAARADTALAL